MRQMQRPYPLTGQEGPLGACLEQPAARGGVSDSGGEQDENREQRPSSKAQACLHECSLWEKQRDRWSKVNPPRSTLQV